MTDTTATRQAIARAAETFTFGRSLAQTACPFMNSHRDGECQKCRDMAAHDAEIARLWREAAS